MTVYINDTPRTITLRPWVEDAQQWGPCMMDENEQSIREGMDITQEEYDEIVSYWQEEVALYNAGKFSESLGDPDENFTREFGFWAD